MRKSLSDIAHMVRDIPYHDALPEAVASLHTYLTDSGHCIMCVPKCFVDAVSPDNFWLYETAVPVRYVLEKGWEPIPGTDAITVDVPYDDDFGVEVPERYDEF